MKKIVFLPLFLMLIFPLTSQEQEPITPQAGLEEEVTEEAGLTEEAESEPSDPGPVKPKKNSEKQEAPASSEALSPPPPAEETPETEAAAPTTSTGPVAADPAPSVAPAVPPETSAVPAVAQNLPSAEPGSYEDLLSRLVAMEELVFQGELGIEGVRGFRDEVSQAGYPELEAEAALLEFLLIRKSEEEARLQGLEGFLKSLEEEAQREEEEAKKLRSRRIWTGVTLGTSLLALGGVTYLRSMGNETYQAYLDAGTPQESAFYQGWWRTWDLASAVTGGVGVLSFTAFLFFFGSSL